MATFIEDLGIVSAYGEAVSKGYTGTEEEFAEMLANLPDKLAEAREYATSAAESSASAASSADGVQRNASIASTAASDAQSAAASALQSATFAETTVDGIEEHEEQCRIYRAEAVAAAEELKTTTLWNDALIDETVTGKIASFSDGCAGMPMKSIVVPITLTQDLNGQSNPYPAGGGVNILPPPVDGTYTGNGITAVVSGGKITLSGTTTASGNAVIIPLSQTVSVPVGSYIHLLNTVANASISPSFELSSDVVGTNIGASCASVNRIYANPKTEVVTWDRIRFYLGEGVATNLSLSPMLCMTNTAIGTYAPYSNICPISGRTGLTLTHSGKNLFDGVFNQQAASQLESNDVTLPAGTYTLSIKYNGTPTWGLYFTGVAQIYNSNTLTFTLTKTTTGRVRVYYAGGITPTDVTEAQIEVGNAKTAYEPYVGQTYPITWETEAGTVYGGTLDVVSGVLTVDRICHTYEGGTDAVISARSMDNNYSCFSIRARDYPHTIGVLDTIAPWNIMSDKLKTVAFASLKNSAITNCVATQGNWAPAYAIKVDGCTTVEEYDAWCAENKPQLSWIFATPQTYQLTPTEVRTLLGENLVYSDADDVTVNYYVDMKGYIDKRLNATRMMIAGVETSFVATKNYAINDFVIVNDTLYRITAVITSGETITPGTNASETTVAEQLIALYNA